MSRLLANYPSHKITVLTSARALRLSPPEGRLKCEHILFPRTNRVGRWGIGRLKELFDWLFFPALVLMGIWVIKRKRIQVMVTIAHGDFVLATAVASVATGIPFVMIVHDDWIENVRRGPSFLRFCRPKHLFGIVARKAAYTYSISPLMQEKLRVECRVKSELQMPAIECPQLDIVASNSSEKKNRDTLRIVYAGNGFGLDCLGLLVGVLKGHRLKYCGIRSCELHLYMPLTSRQIEQLGWCHERIVIHGWISSNELQRVFATADILFLPFSFQEHEKCITTTSFPTKTSDYLASQSPILICAPAYSSAAQYAKRFRFAEVVSELNEEALVQGISKIWKSQEYQEELRKYARLVLEQNHNLTKQRAEFLELLVRLAQAKQKVNFFGRNQEQPDR